MKLLSIIAALLISISVFSQEKRIRFSDGIIYQGEDKISLNEFKRLCDLEKIEFDKFTRTVDFLKAGESKEEAIKLNSRVLVPSALITAAGSASLAIWFSDFSIFDVNEYENYFLPGIILVSSGILFSYKAKTRAGYRRRGGAYLDKAVYKYNHKLNAKAKRSSAINAISFTKDDDEESDFNTPPLTDILSEVGLSNPILYKDFVFSRNGERLSMYEVDIIAKELSVGTTILEVANRQLQRSQSIPRTVRSNSFKVFMGGFFFLPGGITVLADPNFGLGSVGSAAYGASLISAGTYVIYNVSTQKRYARKADKNYKRVANNINEAIKATNQ
jgi:hypothetical protein